jgi:hypothetical protein
VAEKIAAFKTWLATLPQVPSIPLVALDREQLYR